MKQTKEQEEVIERLDRYIGSDDFLNLALKTSSSYNNGELEYCEATECFFKGNEPLYRILKDEQYQHEPGVGGFHRYSSKLVRLSDEKTIVSSENFGTWDTYIDDSQDFDNIKKAGTKRHTKDSFGDFFFENLRSFKIPYQKIHFSFQSYDS